MAVFVFIFGVLPAGLLSIVSFLILLAGIRYGEWVSVVLGMSGVIGGIGMCVLAYGRMTRYAMVMVGVGLIALAPAMVASILNPASLLNPMVLYFIVSPVCVIVIRLRQGWSKGSSQHE